MRQQPPASSLAARDRSQRSRSASQRRRLHRGKSSEAVPAAPVAVTSQEVKERLIRSDVGAGFHPENGHLLWWASSRSNDTSRFTAAAFINNKNEVLSLGSDDVAVLKQMDIKQRIGWFSDRGIPSASVIGANLQAPISLLMAEGASPETIIEWFREVDGEGTPARPCAPQGGPVPRRRRRQRWPPVGGQGRT